MAALQRVTSPTHPALSTRPINAVKPAPPDFPALSLPRRVPPRVLAAPRPCPGADGRMRASHVHCTPWIPAITALRAHRLFRLLSSLAASEQSVDRHWLVSALP